MIEVTHELPQIDAHATLQDILPNLLQIGQYGCQRPADARVNVQLAASNRKVYIVLASGINV